MTNIRTNRNLEAYKESNRIYQNAWYHANKASALQTRKSRLNLIKAKIKEYKANRGCERCTENHFICLDFHHPDPSTKDCHPANLAATKGWSFEKIKLELDTLQVLCSNCHRKEHWRLKQEMPQNQD